MTRKRLTYILAACALVALLCVAALLRWGNPVQSAVASNTVSPGALGACFLGGIFGGCGDGDQFAPIPIYSFGTDQYPYYGKSALLSWTTAYITDTGQTGVCMLTGGDGGYTLDDNGNQVPVPYFNSQLVTTPNGQISTNVIKGTTNTYMLWCVESYLTGYSVPETVSVNIHSVPPPASTMTLTASAPEYGKPSTLTWSASTYTSFDSCLVGGGQWGSAGKAVKGSDSMSTSNLTQNTQYWFKCHDTYYGWLTPVYATAYIKPTMTLTATPSTERQGIDSSVLAVSIAQHISPFYACELDDPNGAPLKSYSGAANTTDNVTVMATSTSVYTLQCGDTGQFSTQATITVSIGPTLSITANNTPTQLTIPPDTSADIRWTSLNQKPNSCSVSYSTSGGSCVSTSKSIATQGAYDWKAFTMGSDSYLAVANAYDGTTYNLNSKIYKWIPSLGCFGKDIGSACGTAFQSIATNGAAKWDSFTVSGTTYIVVANSRNDTTRSVNSKVYKWQSAQACFGNGTTCGTAFQSIATNGAVDVKAVVAGANTYLAVANYRNDTSYAVNSSIYTWMTGSSCFGDGTTCGAVLEPIPTKGAYRMESFSIGSDVYLAFSSAFDGSSYNLPSAIYKYTATGTNCPAGGGFGNGTTHSCGVPVQTLNTSGAYGFTYFSVDNIGYLAVANSYDGTSFNINSKIYQWMTGSSCFGDGTTCGASFQSIATNGATQMQIFFVGADPYLVAVNAYDGTTYNTDSSIYQWMRGSKCFGNGAVCGTSFQDVPTSGATWWEPMLIGGNMYLAIANYFNGVSRNINSSVMQWAPSGCGTSDLDDPTTWTDDQSPVNGYPTGLFSGARLYTLTCKWPDNVTASSTSVNVVTLPELTLSANGSTTEPAYITPNTSGLIRWSSENVQPGSCSVTNSADSTVWSADVNSSGYPSPVLGDGQQVVYTLSCTSLTGDPASKVMHLTAAAQIVNSSDLSISANRVLKNSRPTITWSAQNLKPGISCSITPTLQNPALSSWDGSGTTWSSPVGGALGPTISAATLFTLRCINAAGDSATATAVANLIPGFKEI